MMVRFGFENVESDFLKYFSFLEDYNFKQVDKRTDGSFMTIVLKNSNLCVRLYFEFIDTAMLLSIIKIGETTAITTFEINKLLNLDYNDKDLKVNGNEYEKAMKLNAEITKIYLERMS